MFGTLPAAFNRTLCALTMTFYKMQVGDASTLAIAPPCGMLLSPWTPGRTPLALTFPPELRDYIPNDWGADVSLSQAAYQTLEDHIYAKGVVLITVRDVRNEELFTNHRLAPRKTEYPSWYQPITPEADEELWRNVV